MRRAPRGRVVIIIGEWGKRYISVVFIIVKTKTYLIENMTEFHI